MEEIFTPGTIVFWVGREHHGFKPIVRVGQVERQYAGECTVAILKPRENRIVTCADYPDGVAWNDFKNTFKYHKLPKGWDCDTKLYTVTYDGSVYKELADYDYTAEGIKKAVEAGVMTIPKMSQFDVLDAPVTKDGYMVRMISPDSTVDRRVYITVPTDRLHRDYQPAKAECDAILAEYQRQASLTDEEWAIEQIDKQLAKWRIAMSPTKKEYKYVRSRLVSLPNIADVETRFGTNGIEWKYTRNKRWVSISPEVD